MTSPSSKPAAADAPLVHEREGVLLGCRLVDAEAGDLRVDGDLGAGPLLDPSIVVSARAIVSGSKTPA